MKKYLAIVLGIIFMLSFAVTAMAQDEPSVTLGGKILIRGWYVDNIESSVPAATNSQSVYSTNFNLTVDAKVADNVRGLVEFETASGTSRQSGLFYWGNYDEKADAQMRIRQAWIQHTGTGLFGVPAGIKAGHMLLSLGEKQFLNVERFGIDAILLWLDPTEQLHIAAGTTKLVEGTAFSANHTDDLDGYLLIANLTPNKDIKIGANYLLAHSDGNLPSEGPIPNCGNLNFQNLGLHLTGNLAAGLSFAAEIDYQFGKAEEVVSLGEDAKFKGYALFAKLGYAIDPITIRGSVAMGSGDTSLDSKINEFQTLQGTDYGLTARLPLYTQIYARSLNTAAAQAVVSTQSGGNHRATGIANTTYLNIGGDLVPVKDLKLSLDLFTLRATKTGAWEDIRGHEVSSNVGWELDAKFSYKIAKNLTYFIEAATFKAGNFYKDAYGEKKTVNQAVHGLSLTF